MKDLGNKQVMSENLKRLMTEKNITAKELSKKLGFPYTTLLSWLKADNYPRIDKIEAMANYFGVQKSDLIEQKEKKPAIDDGLTENQKTLVEFAKSVPEDKAEMILRVMKSILGDDL